MNPEFIHSLQDLLPQIQGYIYPNEIEIHWGLLIVVYPYITGIVAGAVMVAIAGGDAALGFGLPWGSIGLAAGLGIGLSMVAAWYPARLASRLSIVRAVQHH